VRQFFVILFCAGPAVAPAKTLQLFSTPKIISSKRGNFFPRHGTIQHGFLHSERLMDGCFLVMSEAEYSTIMVT
jgi:hypothetical protein